MELCYWFICLSCVLFTERDMTMCGNYQVDEGETCDVGPDREDMCCDRNCQLKVQGPDSCRLASTERDRLCKKNGIF